MKTLVSGSGSGLGKYLQRRFNGQHLTRGESVERFKKSRYDVIMHCASNPRARTSGLELSQYIEDNLLLTQQLLDIPHQHFILISTIDVYPKGSKGREDQDIDLDDLQGGYPVTKAMSESLVLSRSSHPLILRPTAMLGADIRPNSLVRMFTTNPCELTLSASSVFNYVLHDDVGGFIWHCLKKKIDGIYNICSQGNVTLNELVDYYDLQHVVFGDYLYQTGVVDSKKIVGEYPKLSKPIWQVVEHFVKILRSKGNE